MNLEKAILILNVNLNENLVKKLITYIKYKSREQMRVRLGINTDIRNVKGYTLNKDFISDKIYFRYITSIIFQYLPNYNVIFSHNRARVCNQVDLLKYRPGGKYDIHVDYDLEAPRSMSCIINLNENYEGGEFRFFNGQIKEIFTTGDAMMFPAEPIWIHGTEPITKGVRYSINCFLKS